MILLLTLIVSVCSFASINHQIKDSILRGKTSMEDVLRELPVPLRANFTLVREGRALLETSDEFPAAILFGEDAKVLLSFNGSPEQSGFASLDVLEFDEKKNEYVPARFLFNPKPGELRIARTAERLGTTNVYFEPRPHLCKNCHGPQHHPIFETGYPEWKGFFGSERDHLYGVHLAGEVKAFEKFKTIGKPTARYQALIFPDEKYSTMSPYLDEATEQMLGFGGGLNYRPNLIFGALLVRNNTKTIMKRMKQSENYEKYKTLLAFLMDRCETTLLPAEKFTGLVKDLPESAPLLLSTFFLNTHHHLHRELIGKIITAMGVPQDLWNLSLISRMAKPGFGYWSGYGDTYQFVHAEIIREVKLEKFYQVKYFYQETDAASVAFEYKINALGEMFESKDAEASCQAMAASL